MAEGATESPEAEPQPRPEWEGATLTPDALADAVHAGFSLRNRERISRDRVERAVASVTLDEEPHARQSPALRVRRLRFVGEKHRHDRSAEPFAYDQTFTSGVNVICIPDNEVGKSSILKTMKYALTGENGSYDADVRNWITDIWLAFSLDRQIFTILLSTRGAGTRALLLAGEEFGQLETVAEETTLTFFDMTGAEAIKVELQRFFFQRLGLGPLSWSQYDPSTPRGSAERSTSWLTYFQALEIPDSGHRYLLCDPEHAMGNQDGLILSAFLGLHLVEPLNRLGVETSREKKEAQAREQDAAERVQLAEAQIGQLSEEIRAAQARLRAIDAAQRNRRSAVESGEPAQRLLAVQMALVEKGSEKVRLEVERADLNRSLQRRHARVRQLREAISLKLHFTGLDVSLCPNCDATVDVEAVQRERSAHLCRLCGRPADAADAAELATLNGEAESIQREIDDMGRGRDAITNHLSALRREIEALTSESEALRQAAQHGITYALPTPEEETERSELYQRVGRLNAELALARQRAAPVPGDEEGALDLRVLEKVREVLSKEAALRNHQVLERLGTLTQEITRTIGADSINDIMCSPLGKIDLRKHGERVSFGRIQNEGERLRIKLAFFLSMMRLGREPGLGRHPGFLLIDQPCSSEMVHEDAEALASIFRRVDDELAEQVQIICATARSEFEAATAPDKVYGAQNPPYAF